MWKGHLLLRLISKRSELTPIEAKQMARKRPTTIAEYIQAAPSEGQPHLRRLYAILKSVAPEAEEAIKWETPSSWNRASCSLSPRIRRTATSWQHRRRWSHFARNSKSSRLPTPDCFSFPTTNPLPEDLIRKIAQYRLRNMGEGDDFWAGMKQ